MERGYIYKEYPNSITVFLDKTEEKPGILHFPRCFATPNRYIKSETLNLSALAEIFYVNICVFLCCIVLRFT